MDSNNMFGADKWPATARWEDGGTPFQPWRPQGQGQGPMPQQAGPSGIGGAADFMAGNNPYSPVQPRIGIPGFGGFPSAPLAQAQQTQSYVPPPQQPWRTPAANMPYPPTGGSRGNQYIPETYTRQNVPVYDPNQLQWGIP